MTLPVWSTPKRSMRSGESLNRDYALLFAAASPSSALMALHFLAFLDVLREYASHPLVTWEKKGGQSTFSLF